MRHLKFHWVTIIIVIMHVILNVNWFMVVFDRLWSGRAVIEHKYVFLLFFVFFFCVCVYMYLCRYVSNHFNHCIKLFAPCGILIGNKQFLFFFSYSMEYSSLVMYHRNTLLSFNLGLRNIPIHISHQYENHKHSYIRSTKTIPVINSNTSDTLI